ncbi:MAG TPA: hypothetical protein VJZ75_08235, partial [Candidatus Bathyarchaeia archaeon]|nr:hypothetical protein [Candidatus Bathyarchaeia archaeon]
SIERDIATVNSLIRLIDENKKLEFKKKLTTIQHLLLGEGDLAKQIFRKPGKQTRHRTSEQSPIPRRKKLNVFPRFAGLSYKELKSLYTEMVKVDPSLKFYALVPISSEIGNLVDGRRSVRHITKAVSFQYQVKLRERHVLRFLKSLEKLGHLEIA